MRIYDCTAEVEGQKLVVKDPVEIPPGSHRILVMVEDRREGETQPFPDLADFHRRLAAPARVGNTVVEMREEERF